MTLQEERRIKCIQTIAVKQKNNIKLTKYSMNSSGEVELSHCCSLHKHAAEFQQTLHSDPVHYHTEADMRSSSLPTAAAKQHTGQSTNLQLNILNRAQCYTHAGEVNPLPWRTHPVQHTVFLSIAGLNAHLLRLRGLLPHQPNVISPLWCDLCVSTHESKKKISITYIFP